MKKRQIWLTKHYMYRKLMIEQPEIHYKLGGGELGCCVRVSNSCSISDTRRVAHTTNPTIYVMNGI